MLRSSFQDVGDWEMNRQTFFFCGIGGSGMSAIAQVLLHQGHDGARVGSEL